MSAKKPFKNNQRFEDFIVTGQETVEAVDQSTSILAKGAQDMNKLWFNLVQSGVEDSTAAFKALMGCADLREVMEIQSGLTKVNYDKVLAEGRKVSELSLKVFKDSYEPFSGVIDNVAERHAH